MVFFTTVRNREEEEEEEREYSYEQTKNNRTV